MEFHELSEYQLFHPRCSRALTIAARIPEPDVPLRAQCRLCRDAFTYVIYYSKAIRKIANLKKLLKKLKNIFWKTTKTVLFLSPRPLRWGTICIGLKDIEYFWKCENFQKLKKKIFLTLIKNLTKCVLRLHMNKILWKN